MMIVFWMDVHLVEISFRREGARLFLILVEIYCAIDLGYHNFMMMIGYSVCDAFIFHQSSLAYVGLRRSTLIPDTTRHDQRSLTFGLEFRILSKYSRLTCALDPQR